MSDVMTLKRQQTYPNHGRSSSGEKDIPKLVSSMKKRLEKVGRLVTEWEGSGKMWDREEKIWEKYFHQLLVSNKSTQEWKKNIKWKLKDRIARSSKELEKLKKSNEEVAEREKVIKSLKEELKGMKDKLYKKSQKYKKEKEPWLERKVLEGVGK